MKETDKDRKLSVYKKHKIKFYELIMRYYKTFTNASLQHQTATFANGNNENDNYKRNMNNNK